MSDNTSVIDNAIAAAKRKMAARGAKEPVAPKAPKEPKAKPVTDEAKAAAKAAKDAERAKAKADRDAVRAAKKAEKLANKRTPHMSKVEKAAAKLPPLTDAARLALNELAANFTATEISTIAAHLVHFNRVKATERALSQKLEAGMSVRIVGGDSKFVGMEGTVVKAQRIRAYIAVEGSKKPVYVFTSDVEVISAEQATGTSN